MASNMTTGEKLKHPVTAIKQMLGKDTTTGTNVDNAGTNTRATNETGAPLGHQPARTGAASDYSTGTTNLQNEGLPHNRQPLNVSSEEQLSNEMGATNLGTTAGLGNKAAYSENAGTAQDPHAHRHTQGHHIGEGVAGAGVGGVGAYEAEKHLGGHHEGQHHHQGHVLHQGDVDTNQTGGYGKLDEKLLHQRHHTGTHVAEGVAGAGVGGVGAYEAEKHLGHHNRTGDNYNRTGDNLTGGALGSEHVPHHQQHHGHHVAEGVAGAGIGGAGAYEAEKHLGHHNRTGDNFNRTGDVFNRTGDNFNRTGDNLTGGALGSEHHRQHHGHHVGEGVAGAGVGGVGAYEAEKHLGGHHHGHNNQNVLDNSAGTGTGTGAGRVFSPNDPQPHNTGLNVVGMNTPNFSRDLRDHTNARSAAENAPTMGNTGGVIDEDRVNATSLPANPLMSLVTGGKIPPSIHSGAKQAGIDTDRGHGGTSDFMGGNNDRFGGNNNRNINENTGVQDTNRTGRFNDASDINNNQTGLTGGRNETNRAGFTGNDRNLV